MVPPWHHYRLPGMCEMQEGCVQPLYGWTKWHNRWHGPYSGPWSKLLNSNMTLGWYLQSTV